MTHRPTNILLAGLVAAAFSSTSFAQFSFSPGSLSVGANPGGVAVGDVDGDGDMDLATGLRFPDRLDIYLNDGAGNFALGASVPFAAQHVEPEEVLAGDLDGDGDTDFAVILRFTNQVQVVTNQGGLVFALGGTAPIGSNGRGMDMKDMDNDGDLDIAVANRGSNTASVLTNDGFGNFTTQTLTSFGEPRAASFGDLDGDGDMDLAVTNNDAFNVRLFRQNAGTFSDWQILSTAPNQAEGVTIADLDNDGDMDIATGAEDDNVGVNNAVIFMNQGAGVFGAATPYNTSGIGTSGVIAADLDCDGLLDLALGNQDSNNLSILRNLGGGTFGPAMLVPVGINPETINGGDFNGDGLMDIATSNKNSGTLSVVINTTCTPTNSADINGDGVVGPADLAAVLEHWGKCIGCPADINGDGVVGPADLAAVLENWG